MDAHSGPGGAGWVHNGMQTEVEVTFEHRGLEVWGTLLERYAEHAAP
jgi:hypothetical protein